MNRYLHSSKLRKPFAYLLCGLFVVFSLFYAYFLQQTVRNGVAGDGVSEDIAALRSEISDAEFSYSSAVGEVTVEHARSLGFAQIDDPRYVTRTDRGLLVTFNVQTEQ